MRLSIEDIEFIVGALRRASDSYKSQEEKDRYNLLMRKLGCDDRL